MFFSGGLDSTLVAVQLLRERKHVHLITFTNGNIGGFSQQQKEQMRRKQIIKRMECEFGKHITHEEFTWDGSTNINNSDLQQASIWVSLFPMVLNNNDKAYFGITRYSDFWHYSDLFKKAFNSVAEFQQKKLELIFPLEWYKKVSIKQELKKLGYLDLTIHSGDKL